MSSPISADHTAWVLNPYPWEASQALADELGLPLVVAMVLAGRGITNPQAARMFLEGSYPIPDPFLFAHMEAAVETLSETIDRQGRVVIHGDYDADGITATAVLVHGLRDFGLEAEWYLPSRFNEGYGLSRTAVETIAGGGPGVLVTVDCGVNYPDEVRLAQERGLDVLVVDHHRPGPVLPDCSVIHEVVGDYPHGDLCGVGLALKVLHGLDVRRNGARHDELPARLRGLLDLVAIGTIADLAPLQGENRYYVKEGLKLISIGQRMGIRELAAVASCAGAADSGTVAFRLAPRLNAAGRLADPSPPLRLLLTEDEAEAKELAAILHELNGARQDVERQILAEATARVEALAELPPALVLAGSEWHEGVVGIVASRLVERYHRPTILLGMREGVAKGSGRSIAAYDLMAALNACSGYLTVYGGHKQAVGLTLDIERVERFRAAIEKHAASMLESHDLTPVYHADAILRGEDLSADVAAALASLGPFGTGNPRPRLLVVGGSIEQPEPTRNNAHLRCLVEVDGVRTRAIGFRLGGMVPAIREDGARKTLGVQFRVDEWQGTPRPEFVIERLGSDDSEKLDVSGCEPDDSSLPPADRREVPGGTRPHQRPDSLTLALNTVRDLRDRPGRLSAVAQVLASGERVMMLTCSASHVLPLLHEQLPLPMLCGGELGCLARGRKVDEFSLNAGPRVWMVEWEVLTDVAPALETGCHVIALDPPFRSLHIDRLTAIAADGVALHLYYAAEERQETARLLRYLVHPRFAMVCLFRAMQEPALGESATKDEAINRAARMAWREGQVVLTMSDLLRAAAILEELGCGHDNRREAKLDVRSSPTYIAAEAEYEECVRLCLTL